MLRQLLSTRRRVRSSAVRPAAIFFAGIFAIALPSTAVQCAAPVVFESQKLVSSTPAEWGFGQAVAIDGRFAIVGSGDGTQQAFIFPMNGDGSWGPGEELHPFELSSNSRFGFEVAIDGNVAIVGAPNDDNYKGSAFVFEADATGKWTQVAKLTSGEADGDSSFGIGIGLDGDTAVIGANNAADYFRGGSAFVFKRDAETGLWNNVQKLSVPNSNAFGERVSLDGSRVLIGATSSNRAYIFEENETELWTKVAELKPQTSGNPLFGASVALEGNTAVVGAPERYSGAGSAYVFQGDINGDWGLTDILKASDAISADGFGGDVAISGSFILAGAVARNNFAGAAYLFHEGSSGTWGEAAKYGASDASPEDLLTRVAISGKSILVGARGAGAVYAFGVVPEPSTYNLLVVLFCSLLPMQLPKVRMSHV